MMKRLDSESSENDGISVGEDSSGKSTSDHQSYSLSNHSSGKQSSEQESLAKKESLVVFRLRLVVILVLLAASAAVSTVVFLITDSAETDEFKVLYNGYTEKLRNSFLDIPYLKVEAIASLKTAIVAHGVDHYRKWPFVTLSSFDERSANVRALSGALHLSIHPLVTDEKRDEWELYIHEDEANWIEPAHDYQHFLNMSHRHDLGLFKRQLEPIYYLNEKEETVYDPGPGPYLPIWESSPLLAGHFPNENIFKNPRYGTEAKMCLENGNVVFGRFTTAPKGNMWSENMYTMFYANLLAIKHGTWDWEYDGEPFTTIFLPLYDSFEPDRQVTGVLTAIITWTTYFANRLPSNVAPIEIVLDNGCQEPYSFRVDGDNAQFIGMGDLHDRKFDKYEKSETFNDVKFIEDGTRYGLDIEHEYCQISARFYPTQEFFDDYNTKMPLVITFSVAIVFLFAIFMFLVYDRLVERRQKLVLMKALQTSAIVSSLFPRAVRDKLMQEQQEKHEQQKNSKEKVGLKTFINGGEKDIGDQTIANLYPNCTVMFADIAGFTAWSSTREPAQVFVLLQSVYQAFDKIAKRRKVFKVETIGDCYVAVTGLPDPQPNHAVIMGRFAAQCLQKMNLITKELEVTLGPDTGDLCMRFGLNSGPVTAGVLRGDRARFQLFGDTVNTAARMESTGIKNKIHISHATAESLTKAGKAHWVSARKDTVCAKGKGVLSTFWLNPHSKHLSASGSSKACSSDEDGTSRYDLEAKSEKDALKKERLIDWICELLQDRIKLVVASRESRGLKKSISDEPLQYHPPDHQIAIDEVVEAISLPKFHEVKGTPTENCGTIELDSEVTTQLRAYIATIASTYHDNPFHNFEHACHVTMSVNKLLSRIVAPELDDNDTEGDAGLKLYSYTHGINSDPITLLAIIYSAVIHDADHRGCSNMQLMNEQKEMAALYRNKSIAEQNSLDIAWNLLMSHPFEDLRKCMFHTEADLKRFRQVVVNVVLATDIFDKELINLRKLRWSKAFNEDNSTIVDKNLHDLQATIVIEHIIQASDIAHTMQHWHVYRTWNRKLFTEMYMAYSAGRMGADPSTFWYKGEIGFFDNYVIPLAMKLKDCRVFGVSSDEYLSYAIKNRAEWATRGEEIIAEMMNELNKGDSKEEED